MLLMRRINLWIAYFGVLEIDIYSFFAYYTNLLQFCFDIYIMSKHPSNCRTEQCEMNYAQIKNNFINHATQETHNWTKKYILYCHKSIILYNQSQINNYHRCFLYHQYFCLYFIVRFLQINYIMANKMICGHSYFLLPTSKHLRQ